MMSINDNCVVYNDDESEIIIDFSSMSTKQLYEILYLVIKILEKRD